MTDKEEFERYLAKHRPWVTNNPMTGGIMIRDDVANWLVGVTLAGIAVLIGSFVWTLWRL